MRSGAKGSIGTLVKEIYPAEKNAGLSGSYTLNPLQERAMLKGLWFVAVSTIAMNPEISGVLTFKQSKRHMNGNPLYKRSAADELLLNAIQKQDKKAFEVFYKQYCRQLFALAYKYVNQMPVAEEIVHDVFITIWNKADQLNVTYSMKSYLFKAVVNSSLNYIKKEKA